MSSPNDRAEWYCQIDGADRGPLTAGELKQLAADGTLREDHQVWKVGSATRMPAVKVRGLFAPPLAAEASGQSEAVPYAGDPAARDVFISYSMHDKPIADAICATLEQDRVRCWIAPRDIQPGMNWGEGIIKGVNRSRLMVVVFSAASNVSPQVLREVERAVHKGVPIVPFRIENVEMSASLEFFLSSPHWLDAMTPPLEAHIARLVQAIRALLESREPASAPWPGAENLPVVPTAVERTREPVADASLGLVAGIVATIRERSNPTILGAIAIVIATVIALKFFTHKPAPLNHNKELASAAVATSAPPATDSHDSSLEAPSEPLPAGHWPADSPVNRPGAPSPAVAPFDDKKAKELQAAWAAYLKMPAEVTNSIGMNLRLIPPGEFEMGSSKQSVAEEKKVREYDPWYANSVDAETPAHRVRITRAFYLGTYLVTQDEYQRVMGNNPSAYSPTGQHREVVAGMDTGHRPVEWVSWLEASEFCARLSNQTAEKRLGREYFLPTEAQWEYACRAGSQTKSFFGSDNKQLSDYAYYGYLSGVARMGTADVGRLKPNPWGAYDIYGNVGQFCRDRYDEKYYANSPIDDPSGPSSGTMRLTRGGSWYTPAYYVRSAHRNQVASEGVRSDSLGFRVSLALSER